MSAPLFRCRGNNGGCASLWRYELSGSTSERQTDAVRDELVALLPRLRRFCITLAGSVDGGDDLAQAAVVRGLDRLSLWKEGTRLDSWLFRIAQNLHIDSMRARSVRGTRVDLDELAGLTGDDGRAVTEARSDLDAALDAISGLSDGQRVLLVLVVVEGCTYREAAERLGIPIGTVMSRIARARAAVASRIDQAPVTVQ